jgi:Flp pilus assembly protein TadD
MTATKPDDVHPLLLTLLLLITALPLSADSLPELLEKGTRQLEKEKYARAVKTFRQARALDAESQEALAGLGQALYGRALALNQARSRNPAGTLLPTR